MAIEVSNSKSKSRSEIFGIFRANGYKVTPQRIAIAEALLHHKDHPTVQKIYSEVNESFPTISYSTIYKTITFLKNIRLIQELNPPPFDKLRFDPIVEPHAHLICMNCGRIRDWESQYIPRLVDVISNETGFKVTRANMNVSGICKKCQDEKEKARP
jgi:Fur family peroxide stress response transcriptional regulator